MIYVFCRAVVRGLFAILYRFESVGVHNIPSEGGVLICSNHISVRDPISVGIHVKRQVKFMAKAELFNIPVFGWLVRQLGAFPVKRGGVRVRLWESALKARAIRMQPRRNGARQAALSAVGQRSYRLPSLETTSRSER